PASVNPQSEFRDPQSIDPENRLLWRMNRNRLDFEAMRDALLSVAGRLERTIGGPSVKDITSPGSRRRTVYAHLDRLNVPGLFRTFDFPSPDATSSQRDTTTVAPQALFLMNNPFVVECARALLRGPEIANESEFAAKIGRLHALCYGRPATPEEVTLAQAF